MYICSHIRHLCVGHRLAAPNHMCTETQYVAAAAGPVCLMCAWRASPNMALKEIQRASLHKPLHDPPPTPICTQISGGTRTILACDYQRAVPVPRDGFHRCQLAHWPTAQHVYKPPHAISGKLFPIIAQKHRHNIVTRWHQLR